MGNDDGEEIPGSNEPEIVPPTKPRNPDGPQIYADIAAQINQYTDRPDLFLETIERHDPGFIKQMNDEARGFSKKNRDSRFHFGRAQAYTSLVVQVIAALGVLGAVVYLIESAQAGFFTFLGLALLYAVTQGGPAGFERIVKGIASLIKNWKSRE